MIKSILSVWCCAITVCESVCLLSVVYCLMSSPSVSLPRLLHKSQIIQRYKQTNRQINFKSSSPGAATAATVTAVTFPLWGNARTDTNPLPCSAHAERNDTWGPLQTVPAWAALGKESPPASPCGTTNTPLQTCTLWRCGSGVGSPAGCGQCVCG